MLRPRRDAKTPLKYRSSYPSRPQKTKRPLKRSRIDPENVDRNDVDQALEVIEAAPECGGKPSIFIPTEIPQFEVNYVRNRDGAPQYTGLSESGILSSFFFLQKYFFNFKYGFGGRSHLERSLFLRRF
jgi:hypothetical protein